MNYIHKDLAAGGWRDLSLVEQLANIGSEVGRAAKWQKKDAQIFDGAVLRALELFNLTLEDPRWRGRLVEIGRARDVFCDAITGGKEYNSDLTSLEKYFMHFALASRR